LFQAKPDLSASIRRVYPATDSLIANDICGIMMADGRLLTLVSAETSNADGRVHHAIASDDKTKKTFVYRAEGQLEKEAWFGNPEGALRTVLSVGPAGAPSCAGSSGSTRTVKRQRSPRPSHRRFLILLILGQWQQGARSSAARGTVTKHSRSLSTGRIATCERGIPSPALYA
jgi:hypothetical protein